jgi:hypothetical protein
VETREASLYDSLSITDTVFDSLQIDHGWQDELGYNFAHRVPASAFLRANRDYRVEYEFHEKNCEPFLVVFNVSVEESYSRRKLIGGTLPESDVPAEYRENEEPDGAPMCQPYLELRYNLRSDQLTRGFGTRILTERIKLGRSFCYKWRDVLALTELRD